MVAVLSARTNISLLTSSLDPSRNICSYVVSTNASFYVVLSMADLLADPELDPNDVPIVEAAAKAGFDCSSWPNLNGLITAVRTVFRPVSYPD